MRQYILWILAVLISTAAAPAQDAETTVRVEVRLVQIEVRVTGKDGKPVLGLAKEDFSLKEDGVPQEITTFQFKDDPGPRESLIPAPQESPGDASSQAVPSRSAATAPDDLTWVYVLPEVRNAAEFKRAEASMRTFLNEQLRPGFLVSMGGLPFTNNKKLLLTTLEKMLHGSYGGGSNRSGTVDPSFARYDDLAFQRDIVEAQRMERGILVSLPGFSREPTPSGRMDEAPVLSIEQIDRQMLLVGQLALFRYLDLVETMAAYPGKKIIVLLRSGFRFDPNHFNLMREISATAIRHRVSFYVLDSRGLDSAAPDEDRRAPLAWRRPRRRPPNLVVQQAAQTETKDGLVVLGRETGGRAVVDTNDLGEVFQHLVNDSANYYVLGYYPKDLSEKGDFRKIQVELDRPGVKIKAPKGYYESKPADRQTRKERSLSLRQAMNSETRRDFPVETSSAVFAGEDGRPLIFFSSGTGPKEIQTRTRKKQTEVNISSLGRLSSVYSRNLPFYLEQPLTYSLTSDQWEGLRKDSTVLISYTSQTPVAPGRYRWKVVLRDELSGRLGMAESTVHVPDFSAPSTPSTLLLTRQVVPVGSGSQPEKGGGGRQNVGQRALEAGGMTYVPQAASVFRQGDTVHILYHLYHPTAEDLKAASQGMQLGVLRDGQPVSVQMWGQPFPDAAAEVIRYTAGFNTDNLEPGTYTVLTVLPGFEKRKTPHLEARFRLVPAG